MANIPWGSISGFGSGVVRSVQRGLYTTASGSPENITISAIVLGKSFVSASMYNASGTNSSFSTELTSTTNLRVQTTTSGANIAWQVIEYY